MTPHGIAASGPNDIWAVGYEETSSYVPQTLIEHWDGHSWSVVPSPNKDPKFVRADELPLRRRRPIGKRRPGRRLLDVLSRIRYKSESLPSLEWQAVAHCAGSGGFGIER
jgi:hypothetical protein